MPDPYTYTDTNGITYTELTPTTCSVSGTTAGLVTEIPSTVTIADGMVWVVTTLDENAFIQNTFLFLPPTIISIHPNAFVGGSVDVGYYEIYFSGNPPSILGAYEFVNTYINFHFFQDYATYAPLWDGINTFGGRSVLMYPADTPSQYTSMLTTTEGPTTTLATTTLTTTQTPTTRETTQGPTTTVGNPVGSNTTTQRLNLSESCLLQGTRVHTPLGYTPIEKIREGDLIYNQEREPIYVEQVMCNTYTFQTNNPFNIVFKIPKGSLGNKSAVYLTRGHRVIRKNGNAVLPEKLGFLPAPYPEVFDEKGTYTVYHIRVKDSEKNHLVVNGGCVVESWK